jgi:hypothetical protein
MFILYFFIDIHDFFLLFIGGTERKVAIAVVAIRNGQPSLGFLFLCFL